MFVYSCFFLDVNPKWSADFVWLWNWTDTKICRFRGISAVLFSACKIKKSTSESLKTQSHLKKKKDVKKKKEIGYPRVCSAATVCSSHRAERKLLAFPFLSLVCVCEAFYWLCSLTANQCERHTGAAECRWVQEQHQQQPSHCRILQLGALKIIYVLEVGLDTHLQKVFHFIKTSCCASALQLGLCFMF